MRRGFKSLLRRAAWHAVKALVRKHPRAALSAAGAGTRYLVKGAAREGVEAVKEKAEKIRALPERCSGRSIEEARKLAELTHDQREQFLQSLQPEDREALASLAKHANR